MFKITTNRLIIRDHLLSDLHEMHNLYSCDEVMFYLRSIKSSSIEETRKSLEEAINEINSKTRKKYFYAIVDRESNEYIGEIGFTIVNRNKSGSVIDLGYFIKKEYWGKGLVTEASKALTEYAFESLNVIKIEASCVVTNIGSLKVMINLGMKKDSVIKNDTVINNLPYDRVKYSLLLNDYRNKF